jgi:hypothetical protein
VDFLVPLFSRSGPRADRLILRVASSRGKRTTRPPFLRHRCRMFLALPPTPCVLVPRAELAGQISIFCSNFSSHANLVPFPGPAMIAIEIRSPPDLRVPAFLLLFFVDAVGAPNSSAHPDSLCSRSLSWFRAVWIVVRSRFCFSSLFLFGFDFLRVSVLVLGACCWCLDLSSLVRSS